MKITFVATALTALALSGCAHSMMRGSVAMKVSDNEAHVCMGDQDVKAGDRVTLFKNVCTGGKGGGARSGLGDTGSCKKEKLGEGSVERILNEHYSVVKVNPGVQFEEGNIVEKQ